MVLAYLGLVVKIAREFQGRGLVLEDLVGEGNLGLIRAVEDFDPNFGTRFSTYAGYWVEQAIRDALINRTATIRLPVHMVKLLTKWRRTERTLCREGERMPDFEDVAAVLGLSDRQRSLVRKAHRASQLKLESSCNGGVSNWLVEAATDEHGPVEALLEADDERNSLMRRMQVLNHFERAVLSLRDGLDGEPLARWEVGTRLGVSREWVRRIESGAIRKLAVDHHDRAAISRPGSQTRRDCQPRAGRSGVLHPAPATLASELSFALRERHDDLENEAVVRQAARENEEVKELVRAEGPR